MTISAICLEHLFSHMLVYTPWRRRRNALGAPCALCARRRCAATNLCTPRARRERSVTTQSIAGQNSAGARCHAAGAPRKRHCRRWRAVTSPRYGKCKIIRYIFLVFSCDQRGSDKFQIAVPTPWDRNRVWQGLKRAFHIQIHLSIYPYNNRNHTMQYLACKCVIASIISTKMQKTKYICIHTCKQYIESHMWMVTVWCYRAKW